jgi:hypothetical protein
MPSLRKFYAFAFMLCCLSCTIIEDSDIMEESELDALKLIGIDIVQGTTGEETTTASFAITDDQEVNMTTVNGTVTRVVDFEIDNFTSSKMKFRSGLTGDLNGYIFYLNDGRPHTFAVGKGTIVHELYRFKYNTAKKLIRITTFSGEDEILTSDSLLYNTEGYITSLVRQAYTEGGFSGTISMEYIGQDEFVSLSEVKIGSVEYQQQSNGGCPNNTPQNNCTSFSRFIPGQGGGDVRVVIINVDGIGLQDEFSLQDNRINVQSYQNREPDTYYFHPMMLLKENLDKGDDLMSIYIVDWWSIGASLTSGGGSGVDEYVKFKFIYGL